MPTLPEPDIMFPLTPWVKRLLVANVAMHLLTMITQGLPYQLGMLVPSEVATRPWTLVTYMFLHAPGFWHLGFNMLGLYFFGPRLEERLGGQDFIRLYLLGGLGGALASFAFAPQDRVVGASAALFAVMIGYAMFWPRQRIYIYGILPVEAWLLVVGAMAIDLTKGIGSIDSGTAHFAHLGGAVFGFSFLRWLMWKTGASRREFQQKVQATPSATLPEKAALARWEAIDKAMLHELNRLEVETLLQKARSGGVRSLTPDERAFLDRMITRH